MFRSTDMRYFSQMCGCDCFKYENVSSGMYGLTLYELHGSRWITAENYRRYVTKIKFHILGLDLAELFNFSSEPCECRSKIFLLLAMITCTFILTQSKSLDPQSLLVDNVLISLLP